MATDTYSFGADQFVGAAEVVKQTLHDRLQLLLLLSTLSVAVADR